MFNSETLQYSLLDNHKFATMLIGVLATMRYKLQFAGQPITSLTK